jgi:hypothetical protein
MSRHRIIPYRNRTNDSTQHTNDVMSGDVMEDAPTVLWYMSIDSLLPTSLATHWSSTQL